MTHALALTTIVLIHGLGGDPHVWDGVVPKLPKGDRVVTVTLPRGDSLDAIALRQLGHDAVPHVRVAAEPVDQHDRRQRQRVRHFLPLSSSG